MKRYARFGCKLCTRRFFLVSRRNEHMERKHGFKRKKLHAGDYGAHFTSVAAILRAIAKRQRMLASFDGAPVLGGPTASSLAAQFDVTDRAMRKRMARLEAQGLVIYGRFNGCVLTQRGFAYLEQRKGQP